MIVMLLLRPISVTGTHNTPKKTALQVIKTTYCTVYTIFLLYADDLLLLSISVCDMQKMIDICKNELDSLDMSINIRKSVCLRIGKRFNVDTADILIAGMPISKCKEFRYLGLYIMSARSFKCNMHEPKMKYFRSLNGILGKVGTSCSLNVVLSLVNSFATPVLLYALEIACLTTTEMNRLNYPFRSIFVKLFSTFDNGIIEQCQYYTGCLPLKHTMDLKCLRFLKSLSRSPMNCKPAGMLFKWLGNYEYNLIAHYYNILPSDGHSAMHKKVWSKFQSELNL
jgi:hypothetical protein